MKSGVRDAAEVQRWDEAVDVLVVGLGAAGAFMVYQQYLIRDRDPQRCFEAFQNNAWLGVAVFTGLVLDYVLVP